MAFRPSTIYLATIFGMALILAGMFLNASVKARTARSVFLQKRALVRSLDLTDLCLFTEASYTRHLSMTDLSTPFQDSPLSLEHFPTGALAAPPSHLVRKDGGRD